MAAIATATPQRGDRAVWLRWVLANAACGAAAPAALKFLEGVYLTGSATRAADGPRLVAITTVSFLLVGSAVQWLVLPRVFRPLRWWPVATIAGALLGWSLIAVFVISGSSYRETFRSNLLIFSFVMATIGAAQWLVLRRRVHGGGWWVIASAAGGAAIWPIYSLVATTTVAGANVARGTGVSAVTAVALQGGASTAAYAAIVAPALMWLSSRIGVDSNEAASHLSNCNKADPGHS